MHKYINKKKLAITLKNFAILAIFYFLFKNIHKNYSQLNVNNLKFDTVSLLLSFPFLFASFPLAVYGWKVTLKIMKEDVLYGKCFEFSSMTMLSKYMPGYLWPYIGKIYFCKKEGIPESKAMMSIYMDQWMVVVSGVLIFFVSYLSSPINIIPMDYSIPRYLPLGMLVCIFLHPGVMVGLLNAVLKRRRKEKIKMEIRAREIFELTVIYTGIWILAGIGFNFLINSVYSIGVDKILIVSGILSVSWVIGFLAFFVPMGLGVREAVISILLSSFIPLAVAIVIAIIARIWLVVPDLIYGGYPLIKKTLVSAKTNDPVKNLLT